MQHPHPSGINPAQRMANKKRRQLLVLVGAALLLATYFAREVTRENVRQEIADLKASASEFRLDSALMLEQTTDLDGLLESNAVTADSIASLRVGIARLTLRAAYLTKGLYALEGDASPDDAARDVARH